MELTVLDNVTRWIPFGEFYGIIGDIYDYSHRYF